MRWVRALVVVLSIGALSAATLAGCGDGETSISGGGTGGQAGSDAGGAGGIGGSAGTDGGKCTVAFITPDANAQLTAADDADGDQCKNGFQYTVKVAVVGDEGGTATLYAGTQEKGTATVTAGIAEFDNVTLDSQGPVTLGVSVDAGCDASEDITIDCNAPTCDIVKPIISPTHPKLNGVPASQGGDRVSADNAPYQVAMEVDTSVSDGQPVLLSVSGSSTGLTGTAQGGKAVFPGVTLSPDGDYDVKATCIPKKGIDGFSTGHYTVDSTPPDLNVLKVTASGASALTTGDHFGPNDDADTGKSGLQMRICGTTTATDALDLPTTLGAAQNNFCVGIGTSSPKCAQATSGGAGSSGDGACVDIDCPGNGPFAITTTLKDDAGNPIASTVKNITCSATNPTVQFLDPVGDTAPFSDVSKHILAASMPAPQRRDQDASKPGTQYDVIACTTATDGGALLEGGRQGNTLTQIASASVTPDTNKQCPSQFPSVVKFTGVTIPESSTGQGFVLSKATELKVTVTAASTASGSATIDLWVDSVVPTLSIQSPTGLCGTLFKSSTAVTKDVVFSTSIAPVTFTIDNATVPNQGPLSFNRVTFTGVQFPVGTSQLAASVTKPSGNIGYLQSPCTVQVSANPPPTVTWQTPTSTSRLGGTAATGTGVIQDADGNTAGWQGTLKVCTDIDTTANPNATVQFSANGTNIGSPVPVDKTTACATLDPATVPEGSSVALKATTSSVNGGVGTATINIPVDVTPPDPVTNLTATVKNRRQTSFNLAWTAPNDGGQAATGYQVRVSKSAIDTQAKFDAAQMVPYTTTPAAPGTSDSDAASDLLIETDYYFAVEATDDGGNHGPLVGTTNATRASFKTVDLTPDTTSQRFGWAIDGSADLNGDGFSDVVIGHGEGQDARIYFGSASGPSTTPSVTISGSSIAFGSAVSVVGDVNDDGKPDLAIGSPADGDGKVYVFYGRDSWPTTLTQADADCVIAADSTADANMAGSQLGATIARLGDFNGDGIDDFAVGAPSYNSANYQGLVAIVLGKSGGLGAQVTAPSSGTIVIPGTPGAQGSFGWTITGLNGFYGTADHGLLVSAPWEGGTLQGKLYAFKGQSAGSGTILPSAAANTFTGSNNWFAGFAGLQPLGNVGPSNRPAFAASLNSVAPSGEVLALSGSALAGPFAQTAALLKSSEGGSAYQFGRMVVGGAFSGTSVTTSFIGSPTPDLVVSTRIGGNPRLFFVDGDKIAGAGSTLQNIENLADLVYPLPGTFTDFSRNVTPLLDINKDGYGDIAVGDTDYGSNPITGRVVILY